MVDFKTSERDIALIDELRSGESEKSCVEFKHNNDDPFMIGKLCSALSNTARIEDSGVAYVIWGIQDGDHRVVGTTFSPDTKKVGNQLFRMWLAKKMAPNPALSFRKVSHPDGNIVILEIPAALSLPVEFDGTAYLRIGSATPKLSDHPEYYQKLINNMKPYTWETGIAKSFITEDDVLELIDYPSYFDLTEQRLPDNRNGIIERLMADNLISKDVGGKWNISNLGAILFAKDLNKFDSSLSRKAIRFVAYTGSNRASTVSHRQDVIKGYAVGLGDVVDYINNLLPRNEHIGAAFRKEHPIYPEIAIRELIANALIHQDMTVSGAGLQIEFFKDRLEITNPGLSLVNVDRMIDLPPRSRNEAIASLMRRMRLCEEEGSGLDKVINSVELFQLPPPKFQNENNSMQVVLYGPRSFAKMTLSERIRACYQHATMQYLSGDKMKNSTLCKRFGIEMKNAAQASLVIKATLEEGKIKVADESHPRGGYLPSWA